MRSPALFVSVAEYHGASTPIRNAKSRSPVSERNLILPSLSRVILSSRHLLLLVCLASTSRSLPRHPRFGNRRGDANRPPTTMSRPLATTRRSTRCSGRPMSILSDTLTRYYMTKYHIFVFFFFDVMKLYEVAIFAARHREIAHVLARDLCLTRYHPVPLYPATTSTFPGPIVPYHPEEQCVS